MNCRISLTPPRPLLSSVALCVLATQLVSQSATSTVPVFEDGLAQVVEGFSDPSVWIQNYLWVETEFDSDGDGKLDRVHVDVTRQEQTGSEGLKVAVIYDVLIRTVTILFGAAVLHCSYFLASPGRRSAGRGCAAEGGEGGGSAKSGRGRSPSPRSQGGGGA